MINFLERFFMNNKDYFLPKKKIKYMFYHKILKIVYFFNISFILIKYS